MDPAYVNRLERAPDDSIAMPTRRVVLALWGALQAEAVEYGSFIGDQDRERLLVSAGLVPEVILRAGGWDAYMNRIHAAVIDTYDRIIEASTGVGDG